jgi:hypothetical protein
LKEGPSPKKVFSWELQPWRLPLLVAAGGSAGRAGSLRGSNSHGSLWHQPGSSVGGLLPSGYAPPVSVTNRPIPVPAVDWAVRVSRAGLADVYRGASIDRGGHVTVRAHNPRAEPVAAIPGKSIRGREGCYGCGNQNRDDDPSNRFHGQCLLPALSLVLKRGFRPLPVPIGKGEQI